MYVYTKDTLDSHIETVDTKENTYIKGHSGFILTVYTVHAMYVEGVKRSSKYNKNEATVFFYVHADKMTQ